MKYILAGMENQNLKIARKQLQFEPLFFLDELFCLDEKFLRILSFPNHFKSMTILITQKNWQSIEKISNYHGPQVSELKCYSKNFSSGSSIIKILINFTMIEVLDLEFFNFDETFYRTKPAICTLGIIDCEGLFA